MGGVAELVSQLACQHSSLPVPPVFLIDTLDKVLPGVKGKRFLPKFLIGDRMYSSSAGSIIENDLLSGRADDMGTGTLALVVPKLGREGFAVTIPERYLAETLLSVQESPALGLDPLRQ